MSYKNILLDDFISEHIAEKAINPSQKADIEKKKMIAQSEKRIKEENAIFAKSITRDQIEDEIFLSIIEDDIKVENLIAKLVKQFK